VLPVVVRHFVEPLHHAVVAHLDPQLAAVVEAAGSEVHRADDRRHSVGEQHLSVQAEMLELVDLDPHVVHDPQPAHALDELVLLQGMRRPRHHVELHPAPGGTDHPLDHHRVLVSLVLHE